jgi:D-3-phosphoglycerate dehydrogenase
VVEEGAVRVLIVDKLAPHVAPELESLGVAVTAEVGLKGDAFTAAIARVAPEIIVVRSTEVGAAQIAVSPNLAVVIRAGAGVNTIDLAAASARGVYVTNCPGKNAVAVAELTMAHLLNLDRRVADNVAKLRAHQWSKKEFGKARGIHGRTLAVLGTGNIGQEVIRRALAFGMHVRAWDKMPTPEHARMLGVTYCATALEACRGADALTIHLSLNAETRGLVGRELLEALGRGAYVINTSRGEMIDAAALVEACRTRDVRAGLDVFPDEPLKAEAPFASALADEPNVYGTHHIGASTDQAESAVGDEVVRIVKRYLGSGEVPNCVNLAVHSPATHTLVVRHADRIGVLAGIFAELREAGINVQEMENIVFQGAAAACARIALDRAPSPEQIERIGRSDAIYALDVVSRESNK